MEDIVIRKYQKEDRQSVRDICWDTAFMGEPASAFFTDKEVLVSLLSEYFTDYEPESLFVACSGDKVVGYLFGAKSSARVAQVFGAKILSGLLLKTLKQATLFKRKNIKLLLGCLKSLLRGEFRMPDFSKDYPAVLHINIAKGYRGQQTGARLIASYLEYLSQEKIPGVHLATMSSKAADFFSFQGFSLLHRGKRSYFRHILNNDTPIYIYGKKL